MIRDPFASWAELGETLESYEAKRPGLVTFLEEGNKYWGNTLLPLMRSGHMKHMIDGTYVYPSRVGLFPGLSCMFYCDFCGRNKSAAYDRKAVDHGIAVYKSILADAPKDKGWENRFRISGGQEPLTNPRIGELVQYGSGLGYKLGMYTNGYMLTPQFLNKQPGLTELDYLRFSMYGYNAVSYEVTTKKNAWATVRKNLIHFINTTEVKVGLSWIVLPGKAHDFLDFMLEIKDMMPSLRRTIDFISVREDFSQNSVYINHAERESFMAVVRTIGMMQKTYFPDIKIDYGYQLDQLQRGYTNGPLFMAKANQLDGKGLPQASVQVDTLGNVYAYHGSAFIDRPGSDKFIIGNAENGIDAVVKDHLTSDSRIKYIPSDVEMLDAYDHAISLAVWRARKEPHNPVWTTLV